MCTTEKILYISENIWFISGTIFCTFRPTVFKSRDQTIIRKNKSILIIFQLNLIVVSIVFPCLVIVLFHRVVSEKNHHNI